MYFEEVEDVFMYELTLGGRIKLTNRAVSTFIFGRSCNPTTNHTLTKQSNNGLQRYAHRKMIIIATRTLVIRG